MMKIFYDPDFERVIYTVGLMLTLISIATLGLFLHCRNIDRFRQQCKANDLCYYDENIIDIRSLGRIVFIDRSRDIVVIYKINQNSSDNTFYPFFISIQSINNIYP